MDPNRRPWFPGRIRSMSVSLGMLRSRRTVWIRLGKNHWFLNWLLTSVSLLWWTSQSKLPWHYRLYIISGAIFFIYIHSQTSILNCLLFLSRSDQTWSPQGVVTLAYRGETTTCCSSHMTSFAISTVSSSVVCFHFPNVGMVPYAL